MSEKELELIAYRLIRIACRRFDRTTTDSELANYIMGIVDLQTEIYSDTPKGEDNGKSDLRIK